MKKNANVFRLSIEKFQELLDHDKQISNEFRKYVVELVKDTAKQRVPISDSKKSVVEQLLRPESGLFPEYQRLIDENESIKLGKLLSVLRRARIPFDPMLAIHNVQLKPWSNLSPNEEIVVTIGEHLVDIDGWPNNPQRLVATYDIEALKQLSSCLAKAMSFTDQLHPRIENFRPLPKNVGSEEDETMLDTIEQTRACIDKLRDIASINRVGALVCIGSVTVNPSSAALFRNFSHESFPFSIGCDIASKIQPFFVPRNEMNDPQRNGVSWHYQDQRGVVNFSTMGKNNKKSVIDMGILVVDASNLNAPLEIFCGGSGGVGTVAAVTILTQEGKRISKELEQKGGRITVLVEGKLTQVNANDYSKVEASIVEVQHWE